MAGSGVFLDCSGQGAWTIQPAMKSLIVAVAVSTLGIASSGCTKWGQRAVYQQPREVERRMVGAPQIARSTSTSGSAGFGGASVSDGYGTTVSSGGIAGRAGSFSRTHCIQEAEITYEQPFDLVATPVGRPADAIAGVLFGAAGLTAIAVAAIRSDTIFEPGDPLYEEPADPTAGYIIGGGLIAIGVGWFGYSMAALPKGPPPQTRSDVRVFTETKFVESTGCGLVPADRAAGEGAGGAGDDGGSADIRQRLEKLEELREAGLISEEEYARKRQDLLDQL